MRSLADLITPATRLQVVDTDKIEFPTRSAVSTII